MSDAVTDEQRRTRFDARLVQRESVDGRVGLARVGGLRTRRSIDDVAQPEPFDHRQHLLVVDVGDDLDVDPGTAQRGEGGEAAGSQLGELDRRPVLTIDGLALDRGIDVPAERLGHRRERRPEQGAVQVCRPYRDRPEPDTHSRSVRSAQLLVVGGDAGRVGDKAQLLQMHVAQGAVVEQGACEVEEHGMDPAGEGGQRVGSGGWGGRAHGMSTAILPTCSLACMVRVASAISCQPNR